MFTVELKEGMRVETADGKELGQINRFVLNPETNEVTHIVVEKGFLLPEDKVVPFDKFRAADEDKVILNEDIRDFDDLPPFEERHYVRVNERDWPSDRAAQRSSYPTAPAYYWYPPHGYLGYPTYGLGSYAWPPTETVKNIPADTVPLKEGTNVKSSDGEHVGDVERLFLESGSNRATHFLISQGIFFKDRKLVPTSWVRSVTGEEVRLNVPARLLENLPSYQDK